MIKCKYCSELIQDEALKCKHCNEWLNKENKLKSVFTAVSDKIKTVKEENERKKTEHLFIPTEENPLIVNHVKLYPNKILINNDEIQFSQILQINYNASQSTHNFITTRYLVFNIIAYKIDAENNKKEVTFNLATQKDGFDAYIQSTHNKVNFEKYQLIYSIVAKSSFIHRLSNKIDKIIPDEGFIYDNYIFKTDGNVYKLKKREKIICNIFEAKKNNFIEWGVAWSGLKSSSSNPNEFRIQNGNIELKLLFGLYQTGVDLRITPYENIDVFNFIMKYFIENEKFPTRNILK